MALGMTRRLHLRCVLVLGVMAGGLLMASPAVALGYICAEGGGSAGIKPWAEAVYGWMVVRGGYGSVIILGLDGADTDAGEVFLHYGASAATNLAVPATDANNEAVYSAITAADIVWIRGGDQWAYINAWQGTRTVAAIREVYQRGGVVGGTSAGMHILSGIVSDARFGSLDPRDALRNPYDPAIHFTDDFLDLLPGVLFDTHFTERGRIGRLAVMLARYCSDEDRDILAVGVDDRTALCIESDLTAEVRGEGAVTVLHLTPESRLVLTPGTAPTVTAIAGVQLTAGYRYDLSAHQVLGRPDTARIPTAAGRQPRFATGTLDGARIDDRYRGSVWVDDSDNPDALFLGALVLRPGDGWLEQTVVATRVWDSYDFDENRVGGVEYALAHHPGDLGIWLDGGERDGRTVLEVRPPARLTVRTTDSAAVLLDSHGVNSVDFSTYVSSADSTGPRQSVALEGITLHVLGSGWRYDARRNRARPPVTPGDVNDDGTVDAADLVLLAGYLAERVAPAAIDPDNADLDVSGRITAVDLGFLLRQLPR